jgi:hypothetical protein
MEFDWTQAALAEGLRCYYAGTSLRMKLGKRCCWEHMSRIRRSCKG